MQVAPFHAIQLPPRDPAGIARVLDGAAGDLDRVYHGGATMPDIDRLLGTQHAVRKWGAQAHEAIARLTAPST